MADLLVNFDVGDGLIEFKPKFKGGSWKQRLQVRKNRHPNSAPKPARISNSGEFVAEPPSKRIRLEHQAQEEPQRLSSGPQEARLLSRHTPASNHSRSEGSGPARLKSQGAREVVSSLFTYNPESKTIPTQPEQDTGENVLPSNAPLPEGIESFTSLGVSTTLAAHLLTKMAIKNPTSIQKEAVSKLLGGESDAFIQSQTGSGKTLAYLLPLVQRLMSVTYRPSAARDGTSKIHRDSGLFAIVLAPTRELSKQIAVVLDGLLRCANWIVGGTVIGGEKKKSEKARLRKGLNILVATPGRLVDHLSHTSELDVSSVRWLILDEGDRLMELGFEDDIKKIVEKLEATHPSANRDLLGLPQRRVTVLCSATMKMNVQRLGEISLKDAMHIHVLSSKEEGARKQDGANGETDFSAPAQLKQSFIIVPAKQRFVTLSALLKHTFQRRGSVMKAIVFLSCADTVEFHFTALGRHPTYAEDSEEAKDESQSIVASKLDTVRDALLVKSASNPSLKVYKLHGSLPQSTRTSTLSAFSRSTDPGILLCTDVASRGLDLPSIDLVIEYDPAFSSDDHLHRIGRTARAGKDGRATVFLLPGAEEEYLQILKDSYKGEVGARIVRQDAEEIMKRGFSSADPNAGKQAKYAWQEAATEFQLETERWVQSDARAREMARKAYVSHVRAYATHVVPERHIFDIKGLHLGHLAKAFGLRDKPGSMGRGSTGDKGSGRRTKSEGKDGGRAKENKALGRNEDVVTAAVDRNEAAAKMRRAMKAHMSAADEFNIG